MITLIVNIKELLPGSGNSNDKVCGATFFPQLRMLFLVINDHHC
jgi:hypothetical protein